MIVGLGGGIGAARLWRAVVGVCGADRLTLVVNTADDLWHYGLRVCPDIDTNLYWLSGRADRARGWGLRDETFRCMETVAGLGSEPWFGLGDRDLATHLLRTGWLREGAGLGQVTARLAEAMGVQTTVLPMSEQEVATEVRVPNGDWLGYQDFLVRRAAREQAREVRWAGIEGAVPGPGVLEAITTAELVVLGPSNPVASMLPILSLPGVREALRATRAPVVAVTPVVAGVAIEDPGDAGRARCRAALLRSVGVEHRAGAVAGLYAELADRFVLDRADADQAEEVRAAGIDPIVAPTLVHLDAHAATVLMPTLMNLLEVV